MTEETPTTRRPVFVGGTGRSGTTVTGTLIGSHPDIWLTNPVELKFISEPQGIAAAAAWARHRSPAAVGDAARSLARNVAGRVTGQRSARSLPRVLPTPQTVVDNMRGPWFDPRPVRGKPFGLGLAQTMDRGLVVAATDAYLREFAHDPDRASRELVGTLIEPLARRAGSDRWVETTPSSAVRARDIAALFPDLRMVCTMRDGRDVIASVIRTQSWGPKRFTHRFPWWGSGLSWWERNMRRVHRGIAGLPPGSALVVQMEDLIVRDRDATLHRLLSFLDLPDDPAVARFFDTEVGAADFHQGRYRHDVPADELRDFERAYERTLQRLAHDGVAVPT